MNNLIAKLRKPEDDRGSIVLWTVIIAFGLLLCLGLVVDGGGKLHAKQQAQLVAEEAARAAGQAVITPLAARGTAVVVNPATAMIILMEIFCGIEFFQSNDLCCYFFPAC